MNVLSMGTVGGTTAEACTTGTKVVGVLLYMNAAVAAPATSDAEPNNIGRRDELPPVEDRDACRTAWLMFRAAFSIVRGRNADIVGGWVVGYGRVLYLNISDYM